MAKLTIQVHGFDELRKYLDEVNELAQQRARRIVRMEAGKVHARASGRDLHPDAWQCQQCGMVNADTDTCARCGVVQITQTPRGDAKRLGDGATEAGDDHDAGAGGEGQ